MFRISLRPVLKQLVIFRMSVFKYFSFQQYFKNVSVVFQLVVPIDPCFDPLLIELLSLDGWETRSCDESVVFVRRKQYCFSDLLSRDYFVKQTAECQACKLHFKLVNTDCIYKQEGPSRIIQPSFYRCGSFQLAEALFE